MRPKLDVDPGNETTEGGQPYLDLPTSRRRRLARRRGGGCGLLGGLGIGLGRDVRLGGLGGLGRRGGFHHLLLLLADEGHFDAVHDLAAVVDTVDAQRVHSWRDLRGGREGPLAIGTHQGIAHPLAKAVVAHATGQKIPYQRASNYQASSGRGAEGVIVTIDGVSRNRSVFVHSGRVERGRLAVGDLLQAQARRLRAANRWRS